MHVAIHTDVAVIVQSSGMPVHPACTCCVRWIEQPGLTALATEADWRDTCAGATPVAAKVLVAFAEWLKLGDAASLQSASLAQHPLLAAALDGLTSESAFDEAVDATVELVYCTSTGGQPEPSMLPVVSIIVPSVSFPAAAQSPCCVEACAYVGENISLGPPMGRHAGRCWGGTLVLTSPVA